MEPRLPKVSWAKPAVTRDSRCVSTRSRDRWGRKTGVRRVGGAELDLSALPGLLFTAENKWKRTNTQGASNSCKNLCRFCCMVDFILEERELV